MAKAFAVSVSASRRGKTEIYPLFISGDSGEEAAGAARVICEEFWPSYEGWTGHSAVLVAMSDENAGEAFFDIREGLIDLADDPGEFHCKC